VFATFSTGDEMKTFLELPEVKYNEDVLQRESQQDYLTRKAPELEKIKAQKAKKEQAKEE
jgi:hypothetical protein